MKISYNGKTSQSEVIVHQVPTAKAKTEKSTCQETGKPLKKICVTFLLVKAVTCDIYRKWAKRAQYTHHTPQEKKIVRVKQGAVKKELSLRGGKNRLGCVK